MPINRYIKKGNPIGGLRVVNVQQQQLEVNPIHIRLNFRNIQNQEQIEQPNQQNNPQQIQAQNQEQHKEQGQNQNAERNQEQNQVANNRNNENQNENRGRPRNEGGNQRSIGRGNNRNRMDLD